MEEQRFLKTMIETVKYGEYNNKDALLAILRNSIITYDQTNSYTQKPYQHWENVDLRVPIPMLKEAKLLQAIFQEIAAEIYIETDDYDFNSLQIKPKPVDLDNDNITEHDVVFDEIKDTIIQGIRNAKYIIWIAVAWFTDKDIYNELLMRKISGVNIRIITSDEPSNQYLITDMQRDFDVIKIPLRGLNNRNRFHDKFCIIDFEYVLHGSYNWSKNAQNNEETLATALDRDFVRKFLDEFIKLYIGKD